MSVTMSGPASRSRRAPPGRPRCPHSSLPWGLRSAPGSLRTCPHLGPSPSLVPPPSISARMAPVIIQPWLKCHLLESHSLPSGMLAPHPTPSGPSPMATSRRSVFHILFAVHKLPCLCTGLVGHCLAPGDSGRLRQTWPLLS